MSKKILFFIIISIVLVSGSCFIFVKQKKVISDPTLSRLENTGKIVIGTSPVYPPMEDIDENGNIVGFDIDIAYEIANCLELEATIQPYDRDQLLDIVAEGKVDIVISSITITTEKAQKVAFTNPYLNGGQQIVVAAENEEINKPKDLTKHVIGTVKGTTGFEKVQKIVKNEKNIVVYETDIASKGIEDLAIGKIDACVLDYTVASEIAKDPRVKLAGDPFTQEFYGIAVKKGEEGLITEINKVIRNLKESGKLEEIKNRWFN